MSGPAPGATSDAVSGDKIRHAEAEFGESLHLTHRLEARDRSWIARWVIVIFVVTIAASLAMFSAKGIFTNRWDAVAVQTLDLVRSGVLPVVTLILGYYFGRSAAHDRFRRDESDIA